MAFFSKLFGGGGADSGEGFGKSELSQIMKSSQAEERLLKLLDLPLTMGLGILINSSSPFNYYNVENDSTHTYYPADYTPADYQWAKELIKLRDQAQDLAESGEFNEAAALFGRITIKAPGHDLIMLNLGVSLAEAGRFKASLKVLSKAMEYHPHNQRISNNYEAIKQAAGGDY